MTYRSIDPAPHRGSSVLASVGGAVVAVAVAVVLGVVAFTLLAGLVVVGTYAVGVALVVVPFVVGRRLLRDRHGRDRLRWIGALVATVALGVAVLVVANFVARHPWLLLVLPVAVAVAGRLMLRRAVRRIRAEAGRGRPRVIDIV